MTTQSGPEIDAAILSAARDRWQKVAMIIARVMHGRTVHATHSEYEFVAKRIVHLVDNEHLEAQGDLSRWRHSEVRLKNGRPSLNAKLEDEQIDTHESIKLMQDAVRARPTWLPNLYKLAVLLMNAERWSDADAVLDELIRLSEKQNQSYFLDEARFRKIMCVKSLGRFDEIPGQKAKISPNTEVFLDDGKYRLDDL